MQSLRETVAVRHKSVFFSPEAAFGDRAIGMFREGGKTLCPAGRLDSGTLPMGRGSDLRGI